MSFPAYIAVALCVPLAQAQTADPGARIEVDDVRAAARVIGLEFSDTELELMLGGVRERLAEFARLRAPTVANDVAPAVTFTPFLPGMERHAAAREEREARVETPGTVVRPQDLEELAFLPVAELHAHIRARTVSCVELAEMYLGRLERLDRELHCVVTFTRDRALAQARQLDAELAAGTCRGPLHGIPWGVKDLAKVEGYRTTWGAKPFEDQVFDGTATVVERLDAAGAVLIAKLSVGALAMGDVWFEERTRSPWNTERGSSGSSAGSAAATAAGGVGFSIGTETLGSIVSPSVVCATSALRPTFGRVSRHGFMALSWTMDKVGPITRTVDDAALVFSVIAGHDPRDPFSRERRPVPQLAESPTPDADKATAKPRGASAFDAPTARRIGVVRGAFERSAELEPVLEELRGLGHTVVDVVLPEYPIDELLVVLMAEAATAFDELTRSGQDDQLVRQSPDAWPNLFRAARLIPAVEYLRAQRLRTQLMQDLHRALADVDLLVHAPFAAGILQVTNLTGHPTIVAPYVGPSGVRRDGSPRSVCFTGQLDGDELLLAVVSAWQQANPEHVRHPELPWLAPAEAAPQPKRD